MTTSFSPITTSFSAITTTTKLGTPSSFSPTTSVDTDHDVVLAYYDVVVGANEADERFISGLLPSLRVRPKWLLERGQVSRGAPAAIGVGTMNEAKLALALTREARSLRERFSSRGGELGRGAAPARGVLHHPRSEAPIGCAELRPVEVHVQSPRPRLLREETPDVFDALGRVANGLVANHARGEGDDAEETVPPP
jgi:hypothetical protein